MTDKNFIQKIFYIISRFSITEKVLFSVFTLLFIFASLSLLLDASTQFLVRIPKAGGTLTEGVIGTPRFINPLLAQSTTDRDLTSLIYSGLLRIDQNGELIPDLAESLVLSEDGLTYTVTLKEDITFHDGKKITADDVLFTIEKTQDPVLKSPRRANWDSVVATKIDEKTLTFSIAQPYAPLIYNFTMGIVPEHIWRDIPSEEFVFNQFNIEPIGSGPFTISDVKRNSSGVPTEYTLKAFNNFVLKEPYIQKIVMKFYTNEEELLLAYNEKVITSAHSISPEKIQELDERVSISQYALPRIFGVFFNQNESPVLSDKAVRTALNISIDREVLIENVLLGYGKPATGPIPPILSPFEVLEDSYDGEKTMEDEIHNDDELINEARAILERNGWGRNEDGVYIKKQGDDQSILSFTLRTADVPELKNAAQYVVDTWNKIGADIRIETFDSNELQQSVIRPREYQALLFGEIIGRDLDFYAFWHSSQRNDPGLNIAMYTNIAVDKVLEDARELSDDDSRLEKFLTFEKEILEDIPAVFLYSPDFIYIVPETMNVSIPANITVPSERFTDIHNWYTETELVWDIFTQ